jgi:hypothetical protein
MTPNDDMKDEELLSRYRRAGADAAGPSDSVREAILSESRRVAAELAKQAPQDAIDVSRPAANDSRWKIPAFGTAGAALLAALLFAPRYWETTPPAQVNMAPAPVPASVSAPASPATQAQAKSEAPRLQEVKPFAADSGAAPARQSPSESESLQGVVVTQANRRSSKSAGAPSPIAATPAPTPPPRMAQNYAPTTNSISPLAAAPPAARARPLDLSARNVASAALPVTEGASADTALKSATLDSAVAQGDLAQAALLLDQGAVIDARDETGRTPLMLAVTQDRVEIVRLLLARGADPNAADATGHTPLQQATKRNLRDVAALLEQAGAH